MVDTTVTWCHGIMISRYRDSMESFIKRFQNFSQEAVFPVFFVILERIVHRNARYLIGAGQDAAIFISEDHFSNGLFLVNREPMCRRLFSEHPDGLPNWFNDDTMMSWCLGGMVACYHGVMVS